MRVIGVVGPAGSGKSTVCRILAQRPGIVHVDCDRLAWETYRPGGPAYPRLLARFGNQILAEDGSVDRGKLAALVFTDPGAKEELEEIVHPLVMGALERILSRERAKGAKMVLVEGALLLSSPHVNRAVFDLFIWLSVPEEERQRRLLASGLARETVAQRFSAQAGLAPPEIPNLIKVDGKGDPEEVAKRVLSAIEGYFREAPTSS
ncbi:MAG: dephospho-CoA kinase [Candidatus Bipolaricaulaceae bacterium]